MRNNVSAGGGGGPSSRSVGRSGRRSRRLVLLSCGVLVGALVPVVALATMTASTFESADGNLDVTNNDKTDWVNIGTRVEGEELGSGKDDNSLGQGAKEDLVNTTVVNGSIPPNKSDLTRFYVADEEAGGDHFLYLAWQRTNTLGSANMDFEINKLAQPDLTTAGANVLNRSSGDLLVRYDFTNGGTNPSITLVKWVTADGGGKSDCFKNQSVPCWGALQDDDMLDGTNDQQIQLSGAGFANGSINATTVSDSIQDPPVSLPEATFGEAGINLTDAGVFTEGECTSFGSVWLKSRSAAAFDAELKDFIAPQEVNINNCGDLVIEKITLGDVGTFGFDSDTLPDKTETDEDTKFVLETTAENEAVSTTYGGLLAGTYDVSENGPPEGWELTSATCDNGDDPDAVEVTADGTVTCTFVNTAEATLTVDKVTVPSTDTTEFTFDPSTNLSDDSFTLASATTPEVFDGLSAGTYGVTESDPTPGFDLTDLSCVRTGTTTTVGTANLTTRSFSVDLVAGDDVTCTFTNTKRGRVDITKTDDDNPAAPLSGVTFTLYDNVDVLEAPRQAADTITDPTLSCTTVADGTCSIENIPLGEYWLVESNTPAGHTAAADQRLTVTAGGSATKDFVNPREFTVITLVCRNSDSSLYSSSVTFGGETKSSLATQPAFATEEELCGLGGATFSPKPYGNYTGGEVNIPQ